MFHYLSDTVTQTLIFSGQIITIYMCFYSINITVSYTHLDVYKRQELATVIMQQLYLICKAGRAL